MKAEVRDLWKQHALGQDGAARKSLQNLKVNYCPDLWADARLEEVMCWLEEYVNARQAGGKTRRRAISQV